MGNNLFTCMGGNAGNNPLTSNISRKPCFDPFIPNIELAGLVVSGYIHRIEPLLQKNTLHIIPYGIYQLCVDFYFVSNAIFMHISPYKLNTTMFPAIDVCKEDIGRVLQSESDWRHE
eukprot:324289_1